MQDTFVKNQNLTPGEFFSVFIYSMVRMKIVKRLVLFLFVVAALSACLEFLSALGNVKIYSILLPFLYMTFPVAFIATAGLLISVLFFLLKPNHFKDITYTFTHWGMEKKGRDFELTKPWSKFLKFKETKKFVLLYMTKNDPEIIKKKIFENHRELADFMLFIKSKLPAE